MWPLETLTNAVGGNRVEGASQGSDWLTRGLPHSCGRRGPVPAIGAPLCDENLPKASTSRLVFVERIGVATKWRIEAQGEGGPHDQHRDRIWQR